LMVWGGGGLLGFFKIISSTPEKYISGATVVLHLAHSYILSMMSYNRDSRNT